MAQAPNDDFESRIKLRAGQSVTSSTVGCTVQQNCVDEKLTGKCVEYHNDQWFEFAPEKPGIYYINISGQLCRDVRGVQLVVFTGQPCQPETYTILSCTSLGSLDNVFVPLPANAGITYFLNVDGYLHDFCDFTLEISNLPKGMPAATLPLAAPLLSSAVVNLHWQLPESVPVTIFKIWRRRADEPQSELLRELKVGRDSYGQAQENYALTDTLRKAGHYFYQIAAIGNTETAPVLLKQVAYRWQPTNTRKFVSLPLNDFPKKAELTIIAAHPVTGKVYRRVQLEVQREHPSQPYFFLQNPELEVGKKLHITIIQNRRRKQISRSYLLPLQESF